MNKYKTGDKVVIRKDLVVGEWYGDWYWNTGKEYMKEKDYVVIDKIYDFRYRVGNGWYITDEMIEGLYKEEEKEMSVKTDKNYIWYLDCEDGTYFLNNLLGVEKWRSHETEEIKNGKDMCYLLTEEQAKKSPFFDKFKKHDSSEKWYYIRMKGNEDEYLNLNVIKGGYSMNDNDEYGPHKTKFTKEECDGIIGTSSILYKEECE